MSACGYPELETFDPLVSHVKAISRNLWRDYVGEVLVTGAMVKRRKHWDKILGMIEHAGATLIKEGYIPENIASDIQSMASRDEFISAMNTLFS